MAADMRPEAIAARLREVARISAWSGVRPLGVDMSDAAITARLREVAELHRLCLRLAAGRRIAPESEK